jgi:hypothetical protein
MRESLEIITEIRGFISSQNPMRFPHQETILVNLLNELENILNPQPIEEPVVEEPVVEEPIVEEVVIIEEPVIEEVVEETVTEEPIVEVVAPKKTTTRKK